jgi:hypothetical protein
MDFPTRILLLCSAPTIILCNYTFCYIFNSGVINDTLFETLNYNECIFNDHSRYVEVEPCQNFKV